MYITLNLWLLKCGSQGGERWNLCRKDGELIEKALSGSSYGWCWVTQNTNAANVYHSKSVAIKVP